MSSCPARISVLDGVVLQTFDEAHNHDHDPIDLGVRRVNAKAKALASVHTTVSVFFIRADNSHFFSFTLVR
jgi:hypothetical protein